MRTIARLVLLFIAWTFCVLGLGPVNGQTSNTNKVAGAAAWSKVTVHGEGDKWWGLDELNQRAIEFLWKKGTLAKGLKVEANVNVFTREPQTMCKFYYTQGFGRPFWEVQIGYDGEVKSFQTGTMQEGGLGRPDPGAPKDGKLPKGARLVSPTDPDKKQ